MYQEEIFIDRTNWLSGEWDGEPDRISWINEEVGYPCIIRRGPTGAWCGYVGIPKDHPLHGKDYDKIYNYETEEGVDIEIHRGLTFSDECSGDHITGVCHDKTDDDVWWFGFDCAHGGDLMPAFLHIYKNAGVDIKVIGDSYKNVEYVKSETEKLAKQLKEYHAL